ncbi:hypothetical protein EYF80_001967 [Liparis tanakae]|uniref:Uncharacterized protein n=1 Tax=Liparis tanakae TaxID=230148 RepID=A0A4Z2JBV1_9TELE|nr:hypothetical protein EYF80_001967 [Liparis tanakae]
MTPLPDPAELRATSEWTQSSSVIGIVQVSVPAARRLAFRVTRVNGSSVRPKWTRVITVVYSCCRLSVSVSHSV